MNAEPNSAALPLAGDAFRTELRQLCASLARQWAVSEVHLHRFIRDFAQPDLSASVFITHAVEEALYLADRVAVMTRRPGRIKEILGEIPLETLNRENRRAGVVALGHQAAILLY